MKKPAYVSAYRDRHGVLRWRFRRPGVPQSQTRELFGTEAWWTWYSAADAAKKVAIGEKRTVPGSLSAVAVAYYASADFKRLAPVTQKTYRNIIERFRDTAGGLPVGKITSAHVRKWVDNRADAAVTCKGSTSLPSISSTRATSLHWVSCQSRCGAVRYRQATTASPDVFALEGAALTTVAPAPCVAAPSQAQQTFGCWSDWRLAACRSKG